MEGITVLNVVMEKNIPFWLLFLVVLCIIMVIGGIAVFCCSDNLLTWILGGICVCVSVCFLALFLIDLDAYQTKVPQYECLVDESVSVEELCEKYNVIERRGEIWVLEEKENDE